MAKQILGIQVVLIFIKPRATLFKKLINLNPWHFQGENKCLNRPGVTISRPQSKLLNTSIQTGVCENNRWNLHFLFTANKTKEND